MDWEPISEERIWDLLNEAWDRMSVQQRRFWEAVRISPEKWQQHPYGDHGLGFWAVAVMGRMVVWYNDIEDGFNHSRYKCYGTIGEYWCNQDKLEWQIQALMDYVEIGHDVGPFCGPPQPGEFPG
jgi:hypothetical protein